MFRRIPCVLMRGGTSRGPYLLASDLPADPRQRDAVLLRIMGSPHPLQVDGIGGANTLTSKVAIVSRSREPGADVDYLFAQVSVNEALVDTKPNCGNMLSGVGPVRDRSGPGASRRARDDGADLQRQHPHAGRGGRADARRPRRVRGRHPDRRRRRGGRADQAHLPRRDGRGDRQAAPDRKRPRRHRRRRGELRRHGDAGDDHGRRGARQDRQGNAGRAGRRPRRSSRASKRSASRPAG